VIAHSCSVEVQNRHRRQVRRRGLSPNPDARLRRIRSFLDDLLIQARGEADHLQRQHHRG